MTASSSSGASSRLTPRAGLEPPAVVVGHATTPRPMADNKTARLCGSGSAERERFGGTSKPVKYERAVASCAWMRRQTR